MDESYCGEEADIFSLGVCLFLMVVGYSPFRMADVQDPYYRCLMKPDKTRFWKIFNDIPISDQFKGIYVVVYCVLFIVYNVLCIVYIYSIYIILYIYNIYNAYINPKILNYS